MKFICVYKSGGDYDASYVIALGRALANHCAVPYEFYCLTDSPKEVNDHAKVVELQHDWPGWWSKIELFNPALSFNQSEGPVLYFDLDVLILRDISILVEVCSHLTYPMMLRSSDKVGEANDWPSSSIMAWSGSMMAEVYLQCKKRGIAEVIKHSHQNISRAGQRTDQGFIRTLIDANKMQDFLPEGYIVFKYPHYMKNPKVFETATILNWTGKPRFHDMGQVFNQIKLLWKENCTNHKINQIL